MLRNMPKSMEWPCSSSKKRLPQFVLPSMKRWKQGAEQVLREREKKVIRQFCELSLDVTVEPCPTYSVCFCKRPMRKEHSPPSPPPSMTRIVDAQTGCVNIVTFYPLNPYCLSQQSWSFREEAEVHASSSSALPSLFTTMEQD